jgi:Molybdenum cofactor biosynthesis enzyme
MKLHKSSFVVNLGVSNSDGVKKWNYFNTLSHKFISLPDNLESICSRFNTNEKFAEFLKRGRWITSFTSYSDEMKDAIELITTMGVNNRTLNIIFTLTTRCNLNCNYCFQNNVFRYDASNNVFLSLPSFIRRQIVLKPTIKKLRLSLFGGEPLLMKSRCLDLLQYIKK